MSNILLSLRYCIALLLLHHGVAFVNGIRLSICEIFHRELFVFFPKVSDLYWMIWKKTCLRLKILNSKPMSTPMRQCLQTFRTVFWKHWQSLQWWHQRSLNLRTMRPRLKGFAKRGFSGRCEYYFLFATLPNVFSYTFGWTTTLQKSKIEHYCWVIL